MGLAARYDLGIMVIVFEKYNAWQAGLFSCAFAVERSMTSEE